MHVCDKEEMSRELNILKNAVKTFDDKDRIIVAVFGSHIYSKKPEDLDVITFSDGRTHDKFMNYLSNLLRQNGFKPDIFVTVKKKPTKKGKNHILIHDLWYKNVGDMRKKEWKTVVNTIRKTAVIVHGNKNYLKSLPILRVTRDELLNPINNWAKRIRSEKELSGFTSYLDKILPKLKKEYAYLKLEVSLIKKDLIGKASRKRVK